MKMLGIGAKKKEKEIKKMTSNTKLWTEVQYLFGNTYIIHKSVTFYYIFSSTSPKHIWDTTATETQDHLQFER